MARHIRFEDLPAWLQPTNFADDEDAIIVSMKELGLPDGMNVEDMPQWMIDLPSVPVETRTFEQVIAEQEQARIEGNDDAYWALEHTLANWQD